MSAFHLDAFYVRLGFSLVMSDLYRSAIHARIAKLPQLPPDLLGDEDEESEAADSIGALPSLSISSSTSRLPRTPNPEYMPMSGASYFSEAVQVNVPASKLDIRVYYTPPQTTDGSPGSVMVCHHGAGFAGLSFALFAKEVTSLSKGELGVLSIDARRHGVYIQFAVDAVSGVVREDSTDRGVFRRRFIA
jgi:protein phosphatase methylesterase 1